MEEIKMYDRVVLKDGREGTAVECFDQRLFLVDVGASAKDWETLTVQREDIVKVIHTES